jgi:hypothetical protein
LSPLALGVAELELVVRLVDQEDVERSMALQFSVCKERHGVYIKVGVAVVCLLSVVVVGVHRTAYPHELCEGVGTWMTV